MWQADRSENLNTIAMTSKNVVLADWLFTTPAVIIQPVTGIIMLASVGIPYTTSRVLTSPFYMYWQGFAGYLLSIFK